MHKAFFSSSEVSQALGVSASTVKRWVDEGVLPARKTAGGHRKILRADVLRLVREGNFPRLNLARLDLPNGPALADTDVLAERLLGGLRVGDIAPARGIIHHAYAAGMAMETLADAVIAPAMAQLGHDWEEGRIDVMHEHRATLLCAGVLQELRPALEAHAAEDRPVAVGGNPEGDPSLLASLLIQMVLLDAGWDAVNLGPHTPLKSFGVALGELRPRLLWLSASYLKNVPDFLAGYAELCAVAERTGVAIAVGGQALRADLRACMRYTFHGRCLTDLAAFAQQLHPRPRPPRRGRPPRQAP